MAISVNLTIVEKLKKNNSMKDDGVVRWSHIRYFFRYTIITYVLVNAVCLIFKGGEFPTGSSQFFIIICAAIVGYIAYVGQKDRIPKE